MQYYDFQHIFDEYSKKVAAKKAEEHDIGKVREKFTEIIDLVGIDSNLLRQHRDEASGEMIDFGSAGRQFCFPETICDFCVEVIIRHTSADFKLLRKGQYGKVALEELEFLIDGFTRYLIALGYDLPTIVVEKFKMNKRLNYHISLHLFQLNQECHNLTRDMENCVNSISEILYEDKVYLTWYTAERIIKFREDIDSIYSYYIDLRGEEIDNFAMENSMDVSNKEVFEDRIQSALLADVLEHDQDYSTLLKEQMKILCTKDYLKKLKLSFVKNNEQLDAIREKHKHELFDNMIQKTEPTRNYMPTHPVYMLHEAIKLADEAESELAKVKERGVDTKAQLEKIKAELLENYPQLFDIPECAHIVHKVKKKGVIECPCCHKEEIIVYEGAAGCIVSKCADSGKQIQFDLDNMSAEIYEIPKGHMVSN